jgi:hypothetical protein
MDSVTKSVLDKYLDRAVAGKNKYGTDMDRKDLNVVQWLQHLQEEMMDATLYVEKLLQEQEKHERVYKVN